MSAVKPPLRSRSTAGSPWSDARGQTAVDAHCRARHPARLVAREVDEGLGDVARFSEAAEGVKVDDPGTSGRRLVLGGEVALEHRRAHKSWSDGIHADPVASAVEGHALREH